MKKHPEADALAARLSAAANQPPGVVNFPASEPVVETPPPNPPMKEPKVKIEQRGSKGLDEDTVPISLRPGRSLLDRYVNAAAERTRKAGRVISAQQIMLEVLERGI